jgi:hypothetical protein
MPEFDHGLKIIARESGRSLARIAGLTCRTWKVSESTLQTTMERLADRVFLASQGKERFAVYFEFVTTWDESTPWSILGKSGMIAERERLPVASLIFILQPSGYVPQNGMMRLKIGGDPTQQVWFREKPLWEISPESWWEDEPGLMALYPLCRHGEQPKESILHAATKIEEKEADAAVRGDLLTSLGIFGRLAYPGLDALSLIGREKMKESKAYQEILEEGEIKGEFNAYRISVLDVIRSRFGKRNATSFKTALNSVDDPKRLRALHNLALKCDGIAELVQAVSK